MSKITDQRAVQQLKLNQFKSTHTQTISNSVIRDILKDSTLVYLLAPFRSKRTLIKLIWTLFLTIVLFANTFYIILSILDFLNYDTITTIQTINEDESQFPTISFCNKDNSKFRFNVLKLTNKTDSLRKLDSTLLGLG